MWQIPDSLELEKPIAERLKPAIEDEETTKKAFGMALGQGKQAFEAALSVCGDNTNIALYISQRWLNDPIVVASKDLYLKTVYNSDSLLDADQLAAKLLEMAEERNASNTFYMLEGKDRLAALKLYAEVKGMIGKNTTVIDQSKTFNKMIVRFVAPENKEEKLLDQLPNEAQLSNNKSPIKLKLVS